MKNQESSSDGAASFNGAEAYRELGQPPAEHSRGPEQDSELAESVRAQASDIFSTISNVANRPGSGGIQAGYREAWDAYATEEEQNPVLREFARMLLSSPAAYRKQRELDGVRSDMDDLARDDPEYPLMRERYQGLVDMLCGFNHQVRDSVVSSGGVSRGEFEGWLGRASQQPAWIHSAVMPGVAGEVSVFDFLEHNLQALDLAQVRFGTVAEDRRGRDLVLTLGTGRNVGVDVKNGGSAGHGFVKRRSSDLIEVGLPSKSVQGFALIPAARETYVDLLRHQLT